MSDGERFGTTRQDGLWILHPPELPAALVTQAIRLHRENFARGRAACLKWGPGSSVSRVLLRTASGPLDMAVKWNHWRGWRGALSDALHGSRARRAQVGAQRLAAAGLRAPALLALAERRGAGGVRESFLLTRFIAGAEPLPVALARLRAERRARRALLDAIGAAVGALHAAGLDHRDLKPSNLLVDAAGGVAFLDLEALAPLGPFAWRRRVRALGLLEAFARDLHPWLSAADRARCLRAYLRAEPAPAPQRDRLVRELEAVAGRRLARWSRRARGERHFPLAPLDTLPCTTADALEAPGAGAREPGA
jgi:tRNA A-37 threonylcarbamoyl transferase component Bud32